MNIQKAKAIRLQILERRNYLRDIDVPLKYSKRSLYGGMQERVRRKADKTFKKGVIQQKAFTEKKLKTVNKYIKDLSSYNINLSVYKNKLASYNTALSESAKDGLISTQMVAPVSPTAPVSPSVTLPLKPKMKLVRTRKVGIGSRSRASPSTFSQKRRVK